MPLSDTNGRLYKLKSETQPSDFVIVDDGFTCMARWSIRKVEQANDGLWIKCKAGRHYLDGQEDTRDGTDALIGIYPA